MAAGIIQILHVDGKQNIADMMTKALGPANYYKFLRTLMFGRFASQMIASGGVTEE